MSKRQRANGLALVLKPGSIYPEPSLNGAVRAGT
jgi:hypothetical protein